MTDHGNKLADLSVGAVTERLTQESDGKAVKRLVAAREYLDGKSPAEISDKFGWPEQTIYSWFDRIETRGLDEALHDESPPGRPATLTGSEFAEFREAVTNPPTAVGFDASAWSSDLAQAYLRREFDHEFSRRHARRLLNEAERSRGTSRSHRSTAGERKRAPSQKDLKNSD